MRGKFHSVFFSSYLRTFFHCFERQKKGGKHRSERETSIGCLLCLPEPGMVQPFSYMTTLQPTELHWPGQVSFCLMRQTGLVLSVVICSLPGCHGQDEAEEMLHWEMAEASSFGNPHTLSSNALEWLPCLNCSLCLLLLARELDSLRVESESKHLLWKSIPPRTLAISFPFSIISINKLFSPRKNDPFPIYFSHLYSQLQLWYLQ